MLLPILLAAILLPAQRASVRCVDTGAKVADNQTQPLRGPAGISAVLKVVTADDHSKDSHDCSAVYQLLVTLPGSGAPVVADLLTSDAEYDRTLTIRLDGFSQDGKRVFGIISEGGKYASTILFEYDTAGGQVQLIDLRKQFAPIMAARCSATLHAIGTTGTGAIALELSSEEKCAADRRWLVNPANGKPQPLPQSASFVSLYN
jgi:hypothetical protein